MRAIARAFEHLSNLISIYIREANNSIAISNLRSNGCQILNLLRPRSVNIRNKIRLYFW